MNKSSQIKRDTIKLCTTSDITLQSDYNPHTETHTQAQRDTHTNTHTERDRQTHNETNRHTLRDSLIDKNRHTDTHTHPRTTENQQNVIKKFPKTFCAF